MSPDALLAKPTLACIDYIKGLWDKAFDYMYIELVMIIYFLFFSEMFLNRLIQKHYLPDKTQVITEVSKSYCLNFKWYGFSIDGYDDDGDDNNDDDDDEMTMIKTVNGDGDNDDGDDDDNMIMAAAVKMKTWISSDMVSVLMVMMMMMMIIMMMMMMMMIKTVDSDNDDSDEDNMIVVRIKGKNEKLNT